MSSSRPRALIRRRGETVEEKVDTTVTLNINAYIPESYVESASQRMSLYKKIAHVRKESDTEDLYEELSDRYGEPPEPVLFSLTSRFSARMPSGARSFR